MEQKNTNFSYLNEKEKRVLSSLYQLDIGSVGKIAKATLLNRTSLYPILEGLLLKGLVSKLEVEGVVVYQPISVTDFKNWAKRRERQTINQTRDLLSWVGKQKNKTDNSLLSEIKYFEGFEGIKSLYGDSWRDNSDKVIYAITDYKNAYKTMGDFFHQDYFINRINHGVKVINLLPESPEGKRDLKMAKKMLREMKFIKLFENLNIEINIYGPKVSIVAFDEKNPSGVIIKNQTVANAFKNIFEYLWKNNKSDVK